MLFDQEGQHERLPVQPEILGGSGGHHLGWLVAAVSDRQALEYAEARDLFNSYMAQGEGRNHWLVAMLKRAEKIYGKGAGERVRGYMRAIRIDHEHPRCDEPGVVPCVYVPKILPAKKKSSR